VEKIGRISRLHIRQSHVALIVKIAAVTLATLTLFSQDLVIIFNDALRSETASHILAIPIIFAYLIYRKRKMLTAVTPLETQSQPKETKYLPTITGILLSATAILLYWYGSYTFTPLEYHVSALPIFAAGLTLILFNPQTLRQLVFPIAFLIFLTPPPSDILYGLGSTLSVVSSEASYGIVNALGVPSTLSSEYGNPTIFITRPNGATMSFAVDIACSGVYSLIGFLIFAVFIAYIIRDKPMKKLALFLVGIPLIYLLNIIRITSILLIGYHYGEETALQAFHLLGGWILIFLGTLLLLAISEKIFKMRIFA
jgi:exosortase